MNDHQYLSEFLVTSLIKGGYVFGSVRWSVSVSLTLFVSNITQNVMNGL